MNAEQEWRFKYSLPPKPRGEIVALSIAEAEQMLLNTLRSAQDPVEAMWQLARFYCEVKQHDKALEYLRKILALQPDTDHKAATVLAMGQTMEQAGDYESAARYYREAFAFEPMHTPTWYFINNNLGYSLNMLGKFDEGEPFCRAAISIDAHRPNAFKNLGIACRGQGRYVEAADCFVKATQADASDSRSLKLLEELIEQHPELSFDFGPQIEFCLHAVQLAHQQRALIPKPAIQRGWRKQWFLFRTRLASWLKKPGVTKRFIFR